MAWTAQSIMPGFGQVITQAAQLQRDSQTASANTKRDAMRGKIFAGQSKMGQKDASKQLNDPSLMGHAGTTPPPGTVQLGSSIPVATLNQGGANIPAWLSNPAAVLGNAMNPYADLLSQIFSPRPAQTALPQNVADAYSNAANAAAARQNAQAQAINVALSLPSTAINLGQREASMAPMSLAGLPTGLGYRDPLQSLRDRIFQTNAAMLPNSGINQLARSAAGASGWAPSLPMF
jgi:hypothetical protein